jgi:hypothetical protein
MDVDVDRLAVILADRLSAIVPAGFQVDAADGMLWYSSGAGRLPGQLGSYRAGTSGTHARANFGVYGDTDEDNIIGLAVQALDELQDYVSEATGEPWPGTTTQPRPHALIRDSRLLLWYGDLGSVVLACEPIPLPAITRDSSG